MSAARKKPTAAESAAFSAGVRWANEAMQLAEQLKKGPRQQLGVRILTDLHRKVTVEAARRGVSLSALIEDMIRRELRSAAIERTIAKNERRMAEIERTLAKSVTKVAGGKNRR